MIEPSLKKKIKFSTCACKEAGRNLWWLFRVPFKSCDPCPHEPPTTWEQGLGSGQALVRTHEPLFQASAPVQLGPQRGNPLQYSCLDNSMDRSAWQATVHSDTKSWTWLSDFHLHLHRPPQAEVSFDQSLTFCRRAEFPCYEPEAPLEASK